MISQRLKVQSGHCDPWPRKLLPVQAGLHILSPQSMANILPLLVLIIFTVPFLRCRSTEPASSEGASHTSALGAHASSLLTTTGRVRSGMRCTLGNASSGACAAPLLNISA